MVDRKKLAMALALGAMGLTMLGPAPATAYCDPGYDSSYYGDSYRGRDYGYDGADYYGGDRDGYGYRDYVCDPDGDRCYRSHRGYWDYHEYYRRNGYHWN